MIINTQHIKMIAFVILFVVVFAFLTSVMISDSGVASELEFGVLVSTDDATDSEEPGETIEFVVKIRNIGTINDSYRIDILNSGGDGDAKDWARIQGLHENETDTIFPNSTRYLSLIIEIPEFTPDSDDAMKGDYVIEVRASSMNSTIESSVFFEIEVEGYNRISLWSDVPGKQTVLQRNEFTVLSYTLHCRNLGNTYDDILLQVPADHFSGEFKDWHVRFGTQSHHTFGLVPLEHDYVVMDVYIDRFTDAGNYSLDVRADSGEDSAVYTYATVFLNLTEPTFGVELEPFPSIPTEVNPGNGTEQEFTFAITNTGNHEGSFTLGVETLLTAGAYKGWTMEFEDATEARVDTLSIPSDIDGGSGPFLQKNEQVYATLYVRVPIGEEGGAYDGIIVSVTSDTDESIIEFVSFDLTVVFPNIRVSDHIDDFWIDPDSGIEEEDSVDINVRIYNDGVVETDTFYVWFYNGKKSSGNEVPGTTSSGLISWERIDNIRAGEHYDLLTTWDDIPGGENDIYVYADKPIKSGDGRTYIENEFSSDGLVLESNENDNTASITASLEDAIDLRPDLTVLEIDVDDKEQGKTTTVTVTVANVGSAKAESGTGQVSLKIDGTSIKADTPQFKGINPFLPEDIDVGDDIDIEFTWDIPEEKDNSGANLTIKVVLDHEDDSDSSNDRQTSYVKTQTNCCPSPTPPPPLAYFACGAFIPTIIIGILLLVTRKIRREGMLKKYYGITNTADKNNRKRSSTPHRSRSSSQRRKDQVSPKARDRTVPRTKVDRYPPNFAIPTTKKGPSHNGTSNRSTEPSEDHR